MEIGEKTKRSETIAMTMGAVMRRSRAKSLLFSLARLAFAAIAFVEKGDDTLADGAGQIYG